METTDVTRQGLLEATTLSEILTTGLQIFDRVLAVTRAVEDGFAGSYAVLMAGTSAADGRDAMLFAPSLPEAAWRKPPPRMSARDAEAELTALAELCLVLAARFGDAVDIAALEADQDSCRYGSQYAREICGLLGRGGG